MKIAEKAFAQDGKLIIQQTHDFNPTLKAAQTLRSNGLVGDQEKKLLGLVPLKLWAEWGKKWGVNPNDTKAMREVVARELNNSDNAHLRVWEGTF